MPPPRSGSWLATRRRSTVSETPNLRTFVPPRQETDMPSDPMTNTTSLSGLALPDLRGRVALVTGASTGIGAAVACAMGAQGMKVAVHYNQSQGPAEEVANAIREA